MEQERLVVAMAAPQDLAKLDELRFRPEWKSRRVWRSVARFSKRSPILWWQRMGNHIKLNSNNQEDSQREEN